MYNEVAQLRAHAKITSPTLNLSAKNVKLFMREPLVGM